ncbi:UDP-galactopyranose mutase [Sphingomonas tabacisoli]|uniref:UDP-galactopyranose mutase n=1 Tax=Sphingomonas tabacisoli TaxID=2249466 RepID=A0ABW4I663_9SPHN
MSRFARDYRVIVWEEPIFDAAGEPSLDLSICAKSGVTVAVPHLNPNEGSLHEKQLRRLVDELLAGRAGPLVRWYYTPMMLPFSRHLDADCTVYDCMDELANFKFAPPELLPLEQELMGAADLVFTGGYSLYEAKRERHLNVHAFPSSVDVKHFGQARAAQADPTDQASLPHPRFGFYGVIDERMDLELLSAVAAQRPDWTFVMIGPVVKISPEDLPTQPNIAWLGGKDYSELPAYLSGWDVAMMPFAINEATRFISPTKTPEYLAAGRPVVSTPIKDVIRHYGELDAVQIANNPADFVAACEKALALPQQNREWLRPVDALLSTMSWDETAAQMQALIAEAAAERRAVQPATSFKPHYDVLVVGAGFAGSVMAERLANDAGKKVLVVDRRPHIGGNAYDLPNEDGILYHLYGPHIFHTNSEEIFAYLSRFTKWRPYEHRVLADVRDMLVPMPINRTTLNMLYGANLQTEDEAEKFLESRAEPVDEIKTSADVVVSKVGTELYKLFFQGYTRKQWGMDPSELDKSVTSRVPTRTNTDDRYFTDTFQAMPLDGFTRMFENMLDHPNIDLRLGVEWEDVRREVTYDKLVFTGPIDEYFGYRHGKLPYRSLRFRHETIDQEVFQPVAVVNYPSEDVPYTRITEYKYLTGQLAPKTSITYEYPSAEGDPYYPIPRPENQALYKRYEAMALAEPDVLFVGRLATYRYYNMDQVVGQALATYRRFKAAEEERQDALESAALRASAEGRPALFARSGVTRSGPTEATATPAE